MELLIKYLNLLDVEYCEGDVMKFDKYMRGILDWNKKVNLTAITERNEFIEKHYIDSILCNDFPEFRNAENVIDIGSGAGFPGVPLAIINPEKQFVLADALNKRVKIVNELLGACSIFNAYAVHGRAEDLAQKKEYRQKFDVCVSRAVANLSVLCEYCLPFIKIGGFLLAYKGPDAENELEQSKNAIKILGGAFDRIQAVRLGEYNHNIVVIKKIKSTPAKYPRKAGTPSKEPI